MELRHYFTVLWRRKWVIFITTVLAVLAALVGTLLMTPQYTATTTLRIATAGGSLDTVQFGDIGYADRLLNTYTQIATNPAVLQELGSQLGLSKPPQVTVQIPANTELLEISAKNTDPLLAAQEANALAAILIAQAKDPYLSGNKSASDILSQQLTQAQAAVDEAQKNYDQLTQVGRDANQIAAARQALNLKQDLYNQLLNQYTSTRVSDAVRANSASIILPATVPSVPSDPKPALNLLVGLLIGLVGGTGLAFLFENLDTTLNTTDQIERVVQGSILAKIPSAKGSKKSTLFNGQSAEEEAFRRLRVNLLSRQDGAPLCGVVITSAEPGEGKSTVAANLARAVAQTKRKVAVVDADLRLPTLHKIFNTPNQIGLSSVLQQQVKLEAAMQPTLVPGLSVLTSGPLPPDPTQLLGSPEMMALVKQLEQQYDMVFFDTPALLSVSDAAVLAHVVDGVMLVVARARSREEAVQSAQQQLTAVRARPVGVVVNRAEPADRFHSDYYRRAQQNHN